MIEQLKTPWLNAGETLYCLGDSLTAAPQGYVAMLDARLAPLGVKVVNGGRGGDKTPWVLTRLQEVIDAKPDAVSIALGGNDAAVGRGIWADEPRVEPEMYKGNLKWIVHLLRLFGGIKKFSIATPFWRFEGATYAMHGDVLYAYRQAAREAAEEIGALCVPLDVALERATLANAHRTDPKTGYLFSVDGTHLTAEGYGIVAAAMLETWCVPKC